MKCCKMKKISIGPPMRTEFHQAFDNTMEIEGGYSDKSTDRGGVTYRGITKRFFPDWPGWSTVDAAKDKSTLDEMPNLQKQVEELYRVEFWDKVRGNDLLDQDIADLMFDTAVLTGVPDAIKYLQRSINLCNRNGTTFADLKVDGMIGRMTLHALAILVTRIESWAVYGYLILIRGGAMMDDMIENPEQEWNSLGWLKRLNINKD